MKRTSSLAASLLLLLMSAAPTASIEAAEPGQLAGPFHYSSSWKMNSQAEGLSGFA